MSDFENPIIVIAGEPFAPLGVISVEAPQQCDFCGKIRELRPYGPNGEAVCFECGMKDESAMKKAFLDRLGLDSSATKACVLRQIIDLYRGWISVANEHKDRLASVGKRAAAAAGEVAAMFRKLAPISEDVSEIMEAVTDALSEELGEPA